MADFGQNRLWPNRLWPTLTLAKSSLICCVWCVVCGVWCVCGVFVCAVWRGHLFHGFIEWGFTCGCWFQGLVWSCSVPGPPCPGPPCPGPPFPKPPFPGPPFPGPPFPWTALNFALFFPLPPPKMRSFLPSLGVLSWNCPNVRI